mmetsp:Transcript_33981/g.83981  ORF Transcript_33981/g.83981 Transcript_33981/m.83981 type:complete len:280 (+) Transcript_33981:2-841(+)
MLFRKVRVRPGLPSQGADALVTAASSLGHCDARSVPPVICVFGRGFGSKYSVNKPLYDSTMSANSSFPATSPRPESLPSPSFRKPKAAGMATPGLDCYRLPVFSPIGQLSRVVLHHGDILKLRVDAIVQELDRSLSFHMGVGRPGALFAYGGPKLAEACRTAGPIKPGEAKLVEGFDLACRHVIVTHGPYGEDEQVLKQCYTNALEVASRNGLTSIAFSCVGTGFNHYPQYYAAEVAVGAVSEWLSGPAGAAIERVVFCTEIDEDWKIYHMVLPNVMAR